MICYALGDSYDRKNCCDRFGEDEDGFNLKDREREREPRPSKIPRRGTAGIRWIKIQLKRTAIEYHWRRKELSGKCFVKKARN